MRATQQRDGRSWAENADDTFVVPNFIVGTLNALVIHVNSDSFLTSDPDMMSGDIIVQGQQSAILCMCPHPLDSLLVISSQSGQLFRWDFEIQKVVTISSVQDSSATCLVYDTRGENLGMSANNAVMVIFRELTC